MMIGQLISAVSRKAGILPEVARMAVPVISKMLMQNANPTARQASLML